MSMREVPQHYPHPSIPSVMVPEEREASIYDCNQETGGLLGECHDLLGSMMMDSDMPSPALAPRSGPVPGRIMARENVESARRLLERLRTLQRLVGGV